VKITYRFDSSVASIIKLPKQAMKIVLLMPEDRELQEEEIVSILWCAQRDGDFETKQDPARVFRYYRNLLLDSKRMIPVHILDLSEMLEES